MIDLRLNYPSLPDLEADIVSRYLQFQSKEVTSLLKIPAYHVGEGQLSHLKGVLFAHGPMTNRVLTCSSGNHALTCLLQALKGTHTQIITEPFTYAAFQSVALQYGYDLVPSAFDQEGLTVEGLEQTVSQTGARLVYLQPTIHNPTCVVMSADRRQALAALAKQKGILLIEDDAYRFLHPDPPPRFLDLLPEQTFHVCSLTKPFNSLIKTAYLVVPHAFSDCITEAIRLTSSGHSALLSGLATWIGQASYLEKLIGEKRKRAVEIQAKVLPMLGNLPVHTFPTAFHLWLELPDEIESRSLVEKMAEQGIQLPYTQDFCVCRSEEAGHFLRVAFGYETIPRIEEGIDVLMKVIRSVRR